MDDLATLSDEQLDAAIASKSQQFDFGKSSPDLSKWSDEELDAGIIAHQMKQTQRLAAVRRQVDDEAAAGQAVTGEGVARYLGRRFVAPLRDPIINAVYGYSQSRFKSGEADEGDLRNIALYEREKGIDQSQPGWAKLAGAATTVPGEVATLGVNKYLMAGKLLAGGIAGSAAEHGTSPIDPATIAHGTANAAVQLGVLASLGPMADKLFPTASKHLLGRMGAHGVTLPASQAAADATTYLLGLNSRYGTIQQFVEGHHGEGFLEVASQLMLGAGFAAASRGHQAGRKYADTLVEALNEAKRKGQSPKKAAESAIEKANATIEAEPTPDAPAGRDAYLKTPEQGWNPEKGLFDAPESVTSAQRSQRAAEGLESLKKRVEEVNRERRQQQQQPIRIGDRIRTDKNFKGELREHFEFFDPSGNAKGDVRIINRGEEIEVEWMGFKGRATGEWGQELLRKTDILAVAHELAAKYPDAQRVTALRHGRRMTEELDRFRPEKALSPPITPESSLASPAVERPVGRTGPTDAHSGEAMRSEPEKVPPGKADPRSEKIKRPSVEEAPQAKADRLRGELARLKEGVMDAEQAVRRAEDDRRIGLRAPVERLKRELRDKRAEFKSMQQELDAARGEILRRESAEIKASPPKPAETSAGAPEGAPAAPKVELSEREQKILDLRGGPNPLTLEAIGQQLNLTRERVRQIEAEARGKLGMQGSAATEHTGMRADRPKIGDAKAAAAGLSRPTEGKLSRPKDAIDRQSDELDAIAARFINKGAFTAEDLAQLDAELAKIDQAVADVTTKEIRNVRRKGKPRSGVDAAVRTGEKAGEVEGVQQAEQRASRNRAAVAEIESTASDGLVGNATAIALPDGNNIPARYEVRGIGTVRASHQVLETGGLRDRIAANEYPVGLQPRDYKAGGEQEKIDRIGLKMNPAMLVTNHPAASEGPPTITTGGTVINGNGRQMGLERAAGAGKFDAYKAELVRQAQSFGFDPKAIEAMNFPALYRVVDLDPNSPEARAFAAAGNVSLTQGQSPIRTASSLGRLITPEVINSMKLEGDTTFSEAVTDPSGGRGFRQALADALPAQEVPRFLTPDNMLTEAGKELVRNMLLSKAFSPDLIERMGEESKQLKRSLEGALPQVIEAIRDYPESNIVPQIEEAIRVKLRNPDVRNATEAHELFSQESVFGGKVEPISDGGRMMFDFILADGNKPLVFRQKLGQLLKDLSGKRGLFAADMPNPVEMVAENLGVAKRPGAKFGAAAAAMAEADRAADEAQGKVMFGGMPVEVQRRRPDRIPDAIKADNPEVEARMEKAHGLGKLSVWERIKETAAAAYKGFTRAQPHLPNRKRFASANEGFRLLKTIPEVASDQTNRMLGAIVDPIGPKQLALLERALLIENQLASIERNEPLRFGFTSPAEVEAYRTKLAPLVAGTPEVQKALQTREAVRRELVAEAIEFGILDEKALDNTAYYHQMINSMMDGSRFTGGRIPLRIKRSFQKARVADIESLPEKFDYNTSFLEAEARWMTELQIEVAKERLIRDYFEPYDILGQLKERAKQQNFSNLVGGPANVARIMELRAKIRESWEMDRFAYEERRPWIEELSMLDPTYHYRTNIAQLLDKLSDQTGIQFRQEESMFKELNAVIARYGENSEPAILAKAVFKWVNAQRKMIEDHLGDRYLTWQKLAERADGYELWSPEPGNIFYRATTIPEHIAEKLVQGLIEEAGIRPEDVRTALAIGGLRRPMVIPTELARQLNETLAVPPEGPVGEASRHLMNAWKVYTLLNPKRAIGYMARNLSGDLEPIIAAEPKAVRFVNQAIGELTGYFKNRLSLPGDLKTARDVGVISSTMTAREIPDVKDIAIFRRLYDTPSKTKFLKDLPAGYFEKMRTYNEFRESIGRYAAFLHYKAKLKANEPVHYGGARKEVVDALRREQGVDVAAAHLARNLLGDYGNLTQFGEWARRHMAPFWSWTEINAKRWPRLTENAFRDAKSAGRLVGVKLATNLMRLGGLYATVWAWNNIVKGDEEADLSPEQRASLHLNLGRREDGSVRVLYRVGSLPDFLEWFGVTTAIAEQESLSAGQTTAGDVATKMAKEPVNKLAQSIRPDIKSTVEVLAGLSSFPDVTNWRPDDRGILAARPLGLDDELRFVRGMLGSGEVVKPGYVDRFIGAGRVDPGQSAMSEIHSLRNKFLKSRGKASSESMGPPAIATMRDAAMAGNFEAFADAKRNYLAGGGNFDKFMDALDRLDPLTDRLNNADEIRFRRSLTRGQREKLKVAQLYATHQRRVMADFWQRTVSASVR